MQKEGKRVSRRWRTAAVLALGIVIGTMLLTTSAGAHVGGTVSHLWTVHIKPKTDARYLQNTKTIVKSGGTVAIGSFDTEIVMCPAGWQAIGGGVDINQVAGGHVASSHPLINGQRALNFADGQHQAANGWFGAINNASDSPSTAPYWVVVVCSK
jgi:hypothetical protein